MMRKFGIVTGIWTFVFLSIQESWCQQTCDLTAITTCGMLTMNLADQSGDTVTTCKTAAEIETCLEPYNAPCKANKNTNGYQMYSQLVASISGFKELCKCFPVRGCVAPLATDDSDSDMDAKCSKFEGVQKCLEPYVEECRDKSELQQMFTSFSNLEQLCNKDTCDVRGIQRCMSQLDQLGEFRGIYTENDKICMQQTSYKQCAEPRIKACAEEKEKIKIMAAKQAEMMNEMLDLLCSTEKTALMQSVKCFNRSEVKRDMEKCTNLSTPKMTDDGTYMEESEPQQCQRLSKMKSCLERAVEQDCGEDEKRVATRVGEAFFKILYDADNLDCPTGDGIRIGGGSMFLAVVILITYILL